MQSPLLRFLLLFATHPKGIHTVYVILISQQGMEYGCVYHGHMFLSGFLLLTEPSSFVTGATNYNKEYLTIMSSVTQDYDHQSSDVLLPIWKCDKVDIRV